MLPECAQFCPDEVMAASVGETQSEGAQEATAEEEGDPSERTEPVTNQQGETEPSVDQPEVEPTANQAEEASEESSPTGE